MSLTQAAALHNISQNKGASNVWGYTMIGILGSFALAGGYGYITKSTNKNTQNTQNTQVSQGGKRHTRKHRSTGTFRVKHTK